MKLCWKRRGCSCLVTYGKYLGLAGFLGRWAVIVCGITILETVFFYSLLLLLLGNNRGVGLSRFSLGELIAAPKCANRTGESGLFFCFLSHLFFRNLLQQFFPFGRYSVWICPVWFFFSLLWRTREPLVLLDIPSLSLRKKDKCLIIISCVSIFFVSILRSILEWALGGWESYIWTMRSGFAGRVFQRDFLGLFHSYLESPLFGVVANLHGNFWRCWNSGSTLSGEFYLAHVCGLDTAAWKPTGREYTNV